MSSFPGVSLRVLVHSSLCAYAHTRVLLPAAENWRRWWVPLEENKYCVLGVGSCWPSDRRHRGTLGMLSLPPGLLLFSSLHFSKLISTSSKHPDEDPKGVMPSANSQLRRYYVFPGAPPNQILHRLGTLCKLSSQIHIEGHKRNKR